MPINFREFMDLKKLFGYGVLIRALAYLSVTAFTAYKIGGTFLEKSVTAAVVLIALFFCGRSLKVSRLEALKYSASWVIIVFILDLIFAVPFIGLRIFTHWNIWFGYSLVLLIPVLAAKNK